MFHLLISFGWTNIFSVGKKKIFLSPVDQLLGQWVLWAPKCVGSVQCKAGTAGFSIHVVSAVFNKPGGDCVEGKNHPWLAGTWHDLACQLPHKPVLPPLGSSTQVGELIILIQEKQLHNNKTRQANKTKPKKTPQQTGKPEKGSLSLDSTVSLTGLCCIFPR